MAPEGCDAVFVLVPLAPGLDDDDASREECYNTVMSRLEKRVGVGEGELRKAVVVKRLYAHREFEADCECAHRRQFPICRVLRLTYHFSALTCFTHGSFCHR